MFGSKLTRTQTLLALGAGYAEEKVHYDRYQDNHGTLYRKGKTHFRPKAARYMLDTLCGMLEDGDMLLLLGWTTIGVVRPPTGDTLEPPVVPFARSSSSSLVCELEYENDDGDGSGDDGDANDDSGGSDEGENDDHRLGRIKTTGHHPPPRPPHRKCATPSIGTPRMGRQSSASS